MITPNQGLMVFGFCSAGSTRKMVLTNSSTTRKSLLGHQRFATNWFFFEG